MRGKIIIILVVLVLLGVLCTAEQVAVRMVTSQALEQARNIMDLVRADDLSGAIAKARELDKRWDEQASMLELVVDHRSTDDVRFAFSRLIAALEGEDREAALIYAAELEGGIEHVYERQALLPENVF